MMKVSLSSLLLASMAAWMPSAQAATEAKFETRVIGDKEKIAFDPAKAYILVESPGAVAVTFFRLPTLEERQQDKARRDEAFAEEHADWVKAHARWEQRMRYYKKSVTTPTAPVEPVEPIEANFAWDALEKRTMVSVGPLNRFSKSGEASLYLQEVPPGEYAYYGSISLGLGVCTCMGTVKFDVKPGKITSFRSDFAFMDENGRLLDTDHKPPEGVEANDAIARYAMIIGNVTSNANDPRLPGDMLAPADFRAMPMIPNWYGTEINRLQPIPGVLAYDGDKVIDLKATSPSS